MMLRQFIDTYIQRCTDILDDTYLVIESHDNRSTRVIAKDADMTTDTSKITTAADELSAGLTKGSGAAKTLGAEIANAIKSLDSRVATLEAGSNPVPPDPVPPSNVGLITNFNPANNSTIHIDGLEVQTQNANKSWSAKLVDNYTIDLEVRSGDVWHNTSGGGDTDAERNELAFMDQWPESALITATEKLTIMPGSRNTASWVDLCQLHAVVNTPPSPFYLNLDNNDRLEVVLQRPDGSNNYAWKAAQPVVRGKEMDLKMQMKMGPTGNGQVDVWVDGTQVLSFRGVVGANNSKYSWKFGLYRGKAAETLIVRHRNMHLVVA